MAAREKSALKPRRASARPRGAGALIAVLASGLIGYFVGKSGQRNPSVRPSPLPLRPPEFDPATIPAATPVVLDARSVDAFLSWVAATPVSKAQDVRDAIAAARGDLHLIAALQARLFDLPAHDFGRHHMLLSTIGELGRPEFVPPLIEFVGLPKERVVSEARESSGCGACTSYLDAAAALQSRAVEMLAYLKTPEALQAVLAFASRHDARAVRLAALDAFIFNHDDSPDAIERARAAARPSEAKFVGIARRTRDSDPAEFEARVLRFYEQHPEERPPSPERSDRRPHGHPPCSRPERLPD